MQIEREVDVKFTQYFASHDTFSASIFAAAWIKMNGIFFFSTEHTRARIWLFEEGCGSAGIYCRAALRGVCYVKTVEVPFSRSWFFGFYFSDKNVLVLCVCCNVKEPMKNARKCALVPRAAFDAKMLLLLLSLCRREFISCAHYSCSRASDE